MNKAKLYQYKLNKEYKLNKAKLKQEYKVKQNELNQEDPNYHEIFHRNVILQYKAEDELKKIKLNRKYLSVDDLQAIGSIYCSNIKDKETKQIIRQFGRYSFVSSHHTNNKKRINILASFINKYKNQLNEKELDSLYHVINNVTIYLSL